LIVVIDPPEKYSVTTPWIFGFLLKIPLILTLNASNFWALNQNIFTSLQQFRILLAVSVLISPPTLSIAGQYKVVRGNDVDTIKVVNHGEASIINPV